MGAYGSFQRGAPHTVAKTVAQGQWRVPPSVARYARAVEVPMLMAVAFPILPGKTDAWRTWMEELDGPRREEFVASRQRAGVHERTFLQSTPMGDLVIVTLEGDDPGQAFGKMMGTTDAFTTWFLEHAKEIHGLDPASLANASPPELVIDTDRVAVSAV